MLRKWRDGRWLRRPQRRADGTVAGGFVVASVPLDMREQSKHSGRNTNATRLVYLIVGVSRQKMGD